MSWPPSPGITSRPAERSPPRLAFAVRDTLKLVRNHPEISPLRTIGGVRFRSFPLREFPYVLYWDYDGTTVVLAALLHGSRDREAILAARHPWHTGELPS